MRNKLLLIPLLVLLLNSCATPYHFYQVYQVKPMESNTFQYQDGNLVYEDANCKVFYSFWSEGGNSGFVIYNKTNEIMYVDLSKSFYIKNGRAFDYFRNREWSSSSTNTAVASASVTNSQAVAGTVSANATDAYSVNLWTTGGQSATVNGDNINVALSLAQAQSVTSSASYAYAKTAGVVIKESPILAIPSHTYKVVSEYTIDESRFLDCDLTQYPAEKATINYTAETSPLSFGNDITYSVGENPQSYTIQNRFYISAISNYAEPSFITFEEREKLCENKRNINTDLNYSGVKVYDKYCKVGDGTMFYNYYKVYTSKILYKKGKYYLYYNINVGGWTVSQ